MKSPNTRFAPADSGSLRFIVAIGCAVVVELGVVGLFVSMPDHTPPTAKTLGVTRIALRALPPPPKPPEPVPPPPVLPPPTPAPPPPLPAPPAPQPPPDHPPIAPHMHRMRPPTPTHMAKHVETPPAEKPVTQPTTTTAPVTPPQAAPPPSAPSVAATATFEAALRSAVQASLVYPMGAQAAHQTGVARVRFSYLDGVASAASIVSSTGFPMLDTAALRTVESAHYPSTPKEFQGRRLTLEVLVVFKTQEGEMDPE